MNSSSQEPNSDALWNIACVHLGVDAYAEGFKLGADLLMETLQKKNHPPQDLLVYPICFSYRHALELTMKLIIRMGRTLEGDRVGEPLRGHHLAKLWEECRNVLVNRCPDVNVKTIDDAVAKFDALDPTSEHFRYATTNKGSATLAGTTQIDLQELSGAAQSVYRELRGVEDYLGEQISFNKELEEYFREQERDSDDWF